MNTKSGNKSVEDIVINFLKKNKNLLNKNKKVKRTKVKISS